MKRWQFLVPLALVLLLSLVLAGCRGGGGGDGGGSSGGSGGEAETSSIPTGFEQPSESETVPLESGRKVEAAKNEVLVYLDEDVSGDEYKAVLEAIEQKGAKVIGAVLDLRTLQVRIDDSADESTLLQSLESQPGVRGTGLNAVVQLQQVFTATENRAGYELYRATRSVSHTKHGTGTAAILGKVVTFDGSWWIGTIGARAAWEAVDGLDSLDETTIGIVDSGLPAEQPVIAQARVAGRFKPDGTPISGDDTAKVEEHGLIVTAFAAGFKEDSTAPVRGVNPYADVVMVDVAEPCPSCSCPKGSFITDVLLGIKTAINAGAGFVNVSIGPGIPCENQAEYRQHSLAAHQIWRESMTGAVQYAKRKGSLVVFISGNDFKKQDDTLLPEEILRDEEIAAVPWHSNALIVGASTEGASTEGASTEAENDACFSIMGDVVDIMAPGAAVSPGPEVIEEPSFHGNGTSFAAPLVTGSAALLHTVNGTLQVPEIRAILLTQADSAIKFNTREGNHANCQKILQGSRTTNPPLSEWQSADSPAKRLDLKGAVSTAILTRGVPLITKDAITLDDGEFRDINVSVTLPTSGVTAMDVLLLIDQSGSYEDDIDSLQAQADAIISDIASRGFDVQFGLAGFSDFPIAGFGEASAGDEAFYLHQPVTADLDAVRTAIINELPLHFGGDSPESQYEALRQAVTGAGLDLNEDGDFADLGEIAATNIGWRTGALKVILLATDAEFHDGSVESGYPGAGRAEALDALKSAGAKVFGLESGGEVEDLRDVAAATGGTAFLLSASSDQIAAAIAKSLDQAVAQQDVTLETIAGGNWVANVTPKSYEDVAPGSTVDFTVSLKGILGAAICDVTDAVYLWARGDGSSLLGRYKQPITVPANIPPAFQAKISACD